MVGGESMDRFTVQDYKREVGVYIMSALSADATDAGLRTERATSFYRG